MTTTTTDTTWTMSSDVVRDVFAFGAMIALAAKNGHWEYKTVADKAYALADAMMERRKKEVAE